MIDKLKSCLGKYIYIVPVIAVGAILLLWPSGEESSSPMEKLESAATDISSDEEDRMEQKLAEVLSKGEGVGRVSVMLTVDRSPRVIYAADINTSASGGNAQDVSRQHTIVTVRDASGNETALVSETSYPIYKGALIICDGGGDPAVRLMITNAVGELLGIGTDKITVMKMKQ